MRIFLSDDVGISRNKVTSFNLSYERRKPGQNIKARKDLSDEGQFKELTFVPVQFKESLNVCCAFASLVDREIMRR